jgi:hypothetical protein
MDRQTRPKERTDHFFLVGLCGDIRTNKYRQFLYEYWAFYGIYVVSLAHSFATVTSAHQDELFIQTQKFISSSGWYPAGEVQPEDEYCINLCLVRKNTT